MTVIDELKDRGYIELDDVKVELRGHVRHFQKEVEGLPFKGKRFLDLHCHDFSGFVRELGRPGIVEYELRSRFQTEKGDWVEVTFFHVKEEEVLEKLDGLELDQAVAFVVLRGLYKE